MYMLVKMADLIFFQRYHIKFFYLIDTKSTRHVYSEKCLEMFFSKVIKPEDM